MRLSWPDDALLATLPAAHRCVSSAVLGGGLTSARHWLNLQVPHDYARTDPDVHLTEVATANGLDKMARSSGCSPPPTCAPASAATAGR